MCYYLNVQFQGQRVNNACFRCWSTSIVAKVLNMECKIMHGMKSIKISLFFIKTAGNYFLPLYVESSRAVMHEITTWAGN